MSSKDIDQEGRRYENRRSLSDNRCNRISGMRSGKIAYCAIEKVVEVILKNRVSAMKYYIVDTRFCYHYCSVRIRLLIYGRLPERTSS